MSQCWIDSSERDRPGITEKNNWQNWQNGQVPPGQPGQPGQDGQDGPPPIVNHMNATNYIPPVVNHQENTGVGPLQANGTSTPMKSDFSTPPHGYADDWHSVRFSNTTQEPITVEVTVAAGQALPTGPGVTPNPHDPNKAAVTLKPGERVDVTFAPGTSANFRSTKGDGSVWNQGEVFFDENNQVIWGNMSYIYGANSNMRMFSSDGQHAGYLGNLYEKAPPAAKVGDYGIQAPFDRFHPSDDPNVPGSATGGPTGAQNPGSAFLYSVLEQGEGYVGRGRPAQINDYDDASSKRFTSPLAVVF